ncbi:MAG: dUTP diphosphatase [Alphaproteobacteria bacterium]|nr:dUTP diphosphatase [Alphaproteobacteria bacterium]MBO4644388.1 dUTP diphosphatase [Alphaproteobacteria bacterium]
MKKVSISVFQNPDTRDLPLPSYATENSAGMDLYAAIPDHLTLAPGTWEKIPTGLSMALPFGYEAQIRSRSGLALTDGIIVLNSPGTIDADYRGEIFVVLYNAGEKVFLLKRGMRIAQMVIAPVIQAEWHEINRLSATQRGTGGFGSTGV